MAGLTKGQIARIEGYEKDNREAAAIILADIKKYGGEGSLAVRWARTIESKYRPKNEATGA